MTPYLINNQKTKGEFTEYMDFTFNNSGDLRVIEDYDELGQDVRKAVVTKKSNDSYGTYMYRLRGLKNITVLRVLSMLTIAESLQALRFMQLTGLGKNRVNTAALLHSIERVDIKVDKQRLFINLSIVTNNLTEDISVII